MQLKLKENCRLAVMLLVSILFLPSTVFAKPPCDWAFVYYIAYDNDLDRFSEAVMKQLRSAKPLSNVAVSVQLDRAGDAGMERYVFGCSSSPANNKVRLEAENSASAESLGDYLAWVKEEVPAKNYVLVFLDHGGKLNNICVDRNPVKGLSRVEMLSRDSAWMDSVKAAKTCEAFNANVGNKVKLLFLQQCGRGSLSTVYSFRNTSSYLLLSPLVVGAPNTYYQALFETAAKKPALGVVDLVKNIAANDKHYFIYTLVDTAQAKKLPAKLEPVVKELNQISRKKLQQSLSLVFEYGEERNFDVASFFDALKFDSAKSQNQVLSRFLAWLNSKLILQVYDKRPVSVAHPPLSGLSLHIPKNEKNFKSYSLNPLYQDSMLDELIRPLLGIAAAAKKETRLYPVSTVELSFE